MLTLGCRLVEVNEDKVFPQRLIQGVVIRLKSCQILHVELQKVTAGADGDTVQHKFPKILWGFFTYHHFGITESVGAFLQNSRCN